MRLRPATQAKYILDLVFVEVWYAVDNHPWKRTPKVYDLMHHKGHDPSSQNIVLQVRIPGSPHTLQEVQVHIVFGNLIELAPISIWRRTEKGRGRVPIPIVLDFLTRLE